MLGGERVEKLLLIGVCIVAVIMIGYNVKAIGSVENKEIKIIGNLLLIFTSLRYITLGIYRLSYNLALLNDIRYFYYASSIGITLLTALAVWNVIPFFKERIQPMNYLLCFLPWVIFYSYLILKQPTQIVENKSFGYELVLMLPFNHYLSLVQGSFVAVIILLCIIGIVGYKHLQIRIALWVISLAQGLLVLDGMNVSSIGHHFFRLFTVTEVFALWTVYYAFSHTVKIIKKH